MSGQSGGATCTTGTRGRNEDDRGHGRAVRSSGRQCSSVRLRNVDAVQAVSSKHVGVYSNGLHTVYSKGASI